MVVTIATEGMDSFSFDLLQEDVVKLLSYAQEHMMNGRMDEDEIPAQIKEESVKTHAEEKPKYRGFLLVKCDGCGERKGFCAKEPIDTYTCRKCGAKTPLANLIPLYLDCDCGKHYKYMTNEDTDSIIHECINCGCTKEVLLNARKTAYVTKKDSRSAAYSWRTPHKKTAV